MSLPSCIAITAGDGIGRLVLNRPEKRNALSCAMWREIPEAVARLAGDPAVRIVVLEGAGGQFSAGADITEFADVYGTRAAAAAYAALLAEAMEAVSGCGKPTLAAISGACVGAGTALALCCDMRFAAADAFFAVTPAKLGIAYSFLDTQRLVACVGASAARDMLFSARRVEAWEALRMRLVDRVFAADKMAAGTLAYARGVAGMSQVSIRVARDFIGRAAAGQRQEDAATRRAYLDVLEAPDFTVGLRAFLAKRTPRF
jgi:enoyl-CoA hydratase/carnithine racemase